MSLSLLAQENLTKKPEILLVFDSWIHKQPDIAIAVAAIQALTHIVKHTKATTMMELERDLTKNADILKSRNKSSISLAAGCDIFSRFVTRTSLEITDFQNYKSMLIERGELFAHMSLVSRKKISHFGDKFVRDGNVVLTLGNSRVVFQLLKNAADQGKTFSVIVAEGRPNQQGYSFAYELQKTGLQVSLILDSAVGYFMESVDFVLCGAEGVVENGGIINLIGTYQVALVAHALHKPFYVATESYKFVRQYPLTQKDLIQNRAGHSGSLSIENTLCDYTPPYLICLLFTDLGILTPSAVSDELIKLYY